MKKYDFDDIKSRIIENLQNIYDPEILVNIYDLGLIYLLDLSVEDDELICKIDMTLTSFGCPIADSLVDQVYNAAAMIDEIDKVYVKLVFDPPWSYENISYEGRLELDML